MPYIALQLMGIESVLTVMGIGSTSGNALIRDLPLIITFGVVAACTYLAGLRACADRRSSRTSSSTSRPSSRCSTSRGPAGTNFRR
jgi:hypothetical protein